MSLSISLSSLLLILLLSVPIAAILSCRGSSSRSPRRRYPAFPSLFSRFSNLPYLFLLDFSSPGPTSRLIKAHKHLNSEVLITGPNRIHISNPSQRLLRQISKFDKSDSYSAFDILGHSTLFSERDPKLHHHRANKVKKLFSKKRLDGKIRDVRDCVEALMVYLDEKIRLQQQQIGKEYDSRKELDELSAAKHKGHGKQRTKVNLLGVFRSFSIDSTTSFTLGKPYDSISELRTNLSNFEKKEDYIEKPSIGKVNDHFNSLVPFALCSPKLATWVAWFEELGTRAKMLKLDQEENEALGKFYHYVEEVVGGVGLDEKDSEHGIGLVDDDDDEDNDEASNYAQRLGRVCKVNDGLVAEVSDMLFAGVESLSTTLSITLLHLFKSHYETPRNQTSFLTLLRREIDSLSSSSATNGDEDDLPSFPSLSDLESLSMIQDLIKEGLRVSSPVPRSLDRKVQGGGLILDDGSFVPQDWTVGISSLETNFNGSNFQNPQVFQPERWSKRRESNEVEKGEEEKCQLMFPFGFGSRSCLGRNLAMAEMVLMFSRFIQCFDLLPEGDGIEIPEGRDWWNKGFENGEVLGCVARRVRPK